MLVWLELQSILGTNTYTGDFFFSKGSEEKRQVWLIRKKKGWLNNYVVKGPIETFQNLEGKVVGILCGKLCVASALILILAFEPMEELVWSGLPRTVYLPEVFPDTRLSVSLNGKEQLGRFVTEYSSRYSNPDPWLGVLITLPRRRQSCNGNAWSAPIIGLQDA